MMIEQAPTNQMRLLRNLLQYLAGHPDWRTIDREKADIMREGWPLVVWYNTIWYAVREGYCRPNPDESRWADTLELIQHRIKLSIIIPPDLENTLSCMPTKLMILPRGELRLHQIKKEFDL